MYAVLFGKMFENISRTVSDETLFLPIYMNETFGARSNVKHCRSVPNNLTVKILEHVKLVMQHGAAFNITKFPCRGCSLTRSYVNAAP